MALGWPWSRQIAVVCPDGTTQFVFRNIDHAFPFYFKQAKVSTAAALQGLKKIKGKVDVRYETDIKHLLVSIDEKNSSIQAHLRAAYVLYMAAPCKKLDYLQFAIDAVRQDERDLRAAELSIRKVVELLSNDGSRSNNAALVKSVTNQLSQILLALNRRDPAVALVDEMKQVAQNADEWQRK